MGLNTDYNLQKKKLVKFKAYQQKLSKMKQREKRIFRKEHQ